MSHRCIHAAAIGKQKDFLPEVLLTTCMSGDDETLPQQVLVITIDTKTYQPIFVFRDANNSIPMQTRYEMQNLLAYQHRPLICDIKQNSIHKEMND